MADPNEEVRLNQDGAVKPAGLSRENSRETGEYHFRGGEIYADAHYEPASATTVPPRYYTPPVRSPRDKRRSGEARRAGHGWKAAGVIALCLVCALLGGLAGAGAMYYLGAERLDAMEFALSENSRIASENTEAISSLTDRPAAAANPVSSGAGELPPAQIYERACSQVVGVTTTVTTANYFGQTRSVPVSGSGFILSADGYILTNYHVIQYAAEGDLPVTVVLHDGTEYDARIVGTEQINDLAVLKIEAEDLTPVTVGDSSAVQVGDEVYAVGNPLGELAFSMTTGHVSALNRVITTEDAESINTFQFDAAVNPGNSGGPVYNTRGEVIGVVTAKYSDTDVEGLGFAIPISEAMTIAEDLVTKGYVSGHAYLGVWLDERYNSTAAQYFNMPLGAYVSTVDPGSAAERAGLARGDVITAVDGISVQSAAELKTVLRQYAAGDKADITVYRDGETLSLTAVFDEKTPESGLIRPESGN